MDSVATKCLIPWFKYHHRALFRKFKQNKIHQYFHLLLEILQFEVKWTCHLLCLVQIVIKQKNEKPFIDTSLALAMGFMELHWKSVCGDLFLWFFSSFSLFLPIFMHVYHSFVWPLSWYPSVVHCCALLASSFVKQQWCYMDFRQIYLENTKCRGHKTRDRESKIGKMLTQANVQCAHTSRLARNIMFTKWYSWKFE